MLGELVELALARLRVHDLDRDLPTERRLISEIHLAHAALTEFGDNVVGAEAHAGGQRHGGRAGFYANR